MNMLEAMTVALAWADEVGFTPHYAAVCGHPGHFSVQFHTDPALCTNEGLERIVNDGYYHETSKGRIHYKMTRKGVNCEVSMDRPSSE
ncbi:hypothetical protein ACUH96_00755 [Dermabacteraceae bacterium P13077]